MPLTGDKLVATNPGTDQQNTAGTTASTTFTATLSGGTACGFAFIAPPSGSVFVFNTVARFNSGASGYTYCDYEVRTGGTVGAGSQVRVATDVTAVYHQGTAHIRGASVSRVTGLTSGSTYNIRQLFRVSANTGTYNDKDLHVSPIS